MYYFSMTDAKGTSLEEVLDWVTTLIHSYTNFIIII